jgi:hypothetical protein
VHTYAQLNISRHFPVAEHYSTAETRCGNFPSQSLLNPSCTKKAADLNIVLINLFSHSGVEERELAPQRGSRAASAAHLEELECATVM